MREKKKKGYRFGWLDKWGGLGGIGKGETIIRILYIFKNQIIVKRKRKMDSLLSAHYTSIGPNI